MEHTELLPELQVTFPVDTVERIGKRKAKDGKIFVTVILKDGKRHRFELLADGTYKFQSLVDPASKEVMATAQIALPEVGEVPIGPVPLPVVGFSPAEPNFTEADVILA